MDNKQLSNLDPKLKEAYDRIMGTPATQSKSADTHLPQTQASSTTETVVPAEEKEHEREQKTVKIHFGGKAEDEGKQAPEEKKKRFSPVFIGIGLFIFIVLYAVIWVKVLNVSLPFLPR